MRRGSPVFLGLVGAGFLLLLSTQALAIPAFSRTYGYACNVCHTAFPKLNSAGESFRLSGYHRLKGEEVPFKIPPVKVGTVLDLPGTPPLSMLIETGFDFHEVKERELATGEQSTTSRNSFNLNEVEILAGGVLGKTASFFLDSPLVESEFEDGDFIFEGPEPPELAFIALNDLFVKDLINVKAGAIELPLLSGTGNSPMHRRLSTSEFEIYNVNARDLLGIGSGAAGLSDGGRRFRLVKPQLGAELWGVLFPREDLRFLYHLGVTNASNRNPDNNRDKGIYGRLAGTYQNQTLGFFVFHANNLVDQEPPAAFPGGANRAWRLGPDVSLNFLNLNLFAQFLWGRDSNPTGFGEDLHYWGGFVEADYVTPLPQLIALARFDWVKAREFNDRPLGGSTRTEPRILAFTVGFQYYIWQNLKFVTEYTFREESERLDASVSTRDVDRVRDHVFTTRFSIVF